MSDLHVNDEFRKNPISLEAGGVTVAITYENGRRFLYDKVKSPKRYIRTISDKWSSNGAITLIEVDGKRVWDKARGGNPWDFANY